MTLLKHSTTGKESTTRPNDTSEELEYLIGKQLKAKRLLLNLSQKTLAERAAVSVRALKNLEGGLGSSLSTLVKVVRSLGRSDWFDTIAPLPNVIPMTRSVTPRERASSRRNQVERQEIAGIEELRRSK